MTAAEVFERRLEGILRLGAALTRKKDELAGAAARDAGFPVKITSLEVELAAEHLLTMAEELPWVQNGQPYGTVAAIFPYDAQAVMLARLGGAALLTGNRLRFSFSSWTPRSAAVLAELCGSSASLEPVLGVDNREFGKSCIKDNRVRVLFISGSSRLGQAYRSHYQVFDKLFFAGPGGMPAAVVFADADVQTASNFIARRAFINGGQYCTTLKKALVHRDLYADVRERLLAAAAELKVGNPLDPQTDIGPIRVERTRALLHRALDACREGRLLAGRLEGEWAYPLVMELENIPDLELFGPFLALKPFAAPEEAVEELIRSRYGFLLAFFGTPPRQALQLFHSHFGMVHDNPNFFFTPLRLPFGGKKASGWILERRGASWLERDGAFLYSKELVRRPRQ